MRLLDAPSREVCVCRRDRTDTPLQALLLLNEVQFFEAARGLGRLAVEHTDTPKARLAYAFRRATARSPDAAELADLLAAWETFRRHFRKNPDEARRAAGDDPPAGVAVDDFAAFTLTANLVLNLDEVLNRE